MQQVNMHYAKTHLSRLVQRASDGEPFIIARNGKPLVKVIAATEADAPASARFGIMPDAVFPDDRAAFKAIAADEIEAGFGGS